MTLTPILNTKLYKRDVKSTYVIRKKIIDYLENNRSNRLTVVVAATGYGKSVTVSEWLDFTRAKYCWISLDEDFTDLLTFIEYLTFGVKEALPGSLPEISDLLEAEETPPEKVISNTLINELDQIDEELVLVLDDYHFIKEQQIHNLINELIRYFPKKLRIVIISRIDPPLNLSTLKSFGQLNEIRMAELNFDESEFYALAKNLMGKEIDKEIANTLLEKTEGWIVGLHMALFAISNKNNIEKIFEEIKGDKHFFTEYLLNEVFLQIEEEYQEILLQATIFQRFSKNLLKSISENKTEKKRGTVDKTLDTIFDRFRTASLFILPLDEVNEWFRFHHLFQNFLLNQLKKNISEETISEYHKIGSEYFYSHNLFEEALHHSVICNNTELIVKIFKENKYNLLDKDHFNILWKWLSIIPEAIIQREPSLLLTRALLHDTRVDLTSIQNDLVVAKNILESNTLNSKQENLLWGEYHAVHAGLSYMSGKLNDTIKHYEKAVKLISYKHFYYYDFALANGTLAISSAYSNADAIAILKNKLAELPNSYINSKMRNSVIQTLVYSLDGNLPEIMKLAPQCQSFFNKNKQWVSFAYAIYYLSEINYQWNNLDQVSSYVKKLEGHKYSGRPFWTLNCCIVKAFSYQAQGNFEQMELALIEMNEFVRNFEITPLMMLFKSCEVELALRQNNIEEALTLSEGVNFEIYPPIFYFFFPQLTYIKLLFSTGDSKKIEEAENRLDELIESGRTTFRRNLLVQALPLRSLIYISKEDEINAIKVLKEALAIAEPGGFIRTFLDLGKPIQKLLKTIYQNDADNAYLQKLLQEFENENPDKEKKQSLNIPSFVNSNTGIVENLSEREKELLKLVSTGLQNKEIAEKLHLSLDTVKKYLTYIYQKLGVKNRVAAVGKATESGIIS